MEELPKVLVDYLLNKNEYDDVIDTKIIAELQAINSKLSSIENFLCENFKKSYNSNSSDYNFRGTIKYGQNYEAE